ncbi:DNA topoisomerase-3 [Scopulibacillus darangshiensis]|uniref:DNA topoisomerase n=1 Tax=Scopulibacillus darangshiensis TaxID=442528 RepID=A0A4R2NSE3_9BACL|nr:type IA DNA topoisomerase [Scopulibacillus darangshiensis]TCP24461.1 DNA topoisomerase-3 [Scopulibacillus darangshiensis]
MGLSLILAEKPSQAKAYSEAFNVEKRTKHYIEVKPDKAFPNGAIITWAIGHLVELNPPQFYDEKYKKWDLANLPIVPKTFSYSVSKDKKEHYNEVEKLLKNAKELVIASDIDREGEAISRLIFQQAKVTNKPIKRLWINSLENDEVRKGMENLRDGKETYNFFLEAQARQKSDWLVGMNLSPLFTLPLQQRGYNGSLSIGRVQSPTVYLIYQRQNEIENFVSKPFFQIEGEFTVKNGSYKGMADVKEEARETVQALLDKHDITGKDQGIIQSVDKKEKRQKSPKLHSLSSLQSAANKKWKYSPKAVLDIVQKLYDKKILSYPRTDSHFITESEFHYLKENLNGYQQILNNVFTPLSLTPNKRYVDGSKVEEHYAIIPTKAIPNESIMAGLSTEEKNIYHEIVAVTLGMFHGDYIFEETTIMTNVKGLPFKSTGKTEKEKGWHSLFPVNADKKDKDTVLPTVSKNEQATGIIGIKEGMTQPPKPYTEGQLINMMKTCGKYVEDDKDVEILKDVEGLGTEATRSSIIEKIKQQNYIDVKKNIVSVTDKGKILCEAIDGTLLSSPSMTAKWESYLKKIGEGQGSQEKFLEQITAFINKMISEVPTQLNVPSIAKKIQDQQQSNGISKCPSCQNGFIIEKKTSKGKFYGCSCYKEGCKVTFPAKMAGKTLGKTIIKSLSTKGKTNKIKGFKSKKGKDFEAALKLDSEFNIEFDFS